MSRAVSVEPVKATPAMRGSPVSVGPIFEPRPGTKCSTSPGMPLACSRRTISAATSGVCSAGFAITALPAASAADHLAGEDREREIPRADAGEHAAAAQAQPVRLAGRARQRQRPAEVLLGPRRVVAQEIDGLAHLGNRVRHGLAGLGDADRRRTARCRARGGRPRRAACARASRPARGPSRAARPPRARSPASRARRPRRPPRRRRARGPRASGIRGARRPAPRRRRSAARAAAVASASRQPAASRRCALAVRQVDAGGVRALGAEQPARRRNARVRAAARALDVGDRVADHLLDRQRLVDDAVDERGVGAVLEQAPHQVRQQFLVRADRRVDAARQCAARRVGELRVQLLAHAVQALELELAAARPREVDDRGRGVRVVRRELRIDAARALEQDARAGEVGDVGVGLARVDRVARAGRVPARA